MFGDGYALAPAEEAARKREREEFMPLWEEWRRELLDGAEMRGVSGELADDPRTLYQLAKLLETARACRISLYDARKVLVTDLLRQLKETGAPPQVQ